MNSELDSSGGRELGEVDHGWDRMGMDLGAKVSKVRTDAFPVLPQAAGCRWWNYFFQPRKYRSSSNSLNSAVSEAVCLNFLCKSICCSSRYGKSSPLITALA